MHIIIRRRTPYGKAHQLIKNQLVPHLYPLKISIVGIKNIFKTASRNSELFPCLLKGDVSRRAGGWE